MDNRLLVARQSAAAGGLLDLVPGAAAAYSLRKLSSTHTDPVVTVRRSSDDDEGSFTATEVRDGTLSAFCGVGDGFVKQWWDQSGNANHASQTTPTRQPQIVSGGAVILEEGKPAIEFDGTDDSLSVSASAILDLPATVFAVITHSPSSSERYVLARQSGSSNGGVVLRQQNGTDQMSFLTIDAASPYPVVTFVKRTGQDLIVAIAEPPNSSIYSSSVLGGTSAAISGFTNATHPVAIGARPETGESNWDSKMQEIIVYPSDQTANRELIEGNIAWSYS